MSEIVRLLQRRADAARRDTEFAVAVRHLAHPIRLAVEPSGPVVTAWEGDGRSPGEDAVVVRAAEAIWQRIACAVPAPGYHSFTAVRRQAGAVAVDGSPLAVAQALHALERLFEILRRDEEDAATSPPDLSAVSGAYHRVTVDGEPLNLYAESCGPADAPALLMLHTAGADSRQYHGLMADARLRAAWRLIAFDMPGHGRSMPPPSAAWQGRVLGRERYLAVCAAFARQVVRRPVTLLGCSMGAAMALYMAARHPEAVAGVVALEAPWRALGRLTPYLAHPAVNAAAHNPAYVRGLMGPAASLQARREAAWIYSQGGFGTYAEDLHFYSEDFDASVHLQGLRAARFGIALLTGAYDYSASPADSERVARMIPGARFVVMPDLGHFPMVEHPARLMDYLVPELERIRAAQR